MNEKGPSNYEKRNPLEKVKWNFYIESPDNLHEVFSKLLSGKEGNYYHEVWVATRDEYPELDGWNVAYSKDYIAYKEKTGKTDCIVVRTPNEKYGKGATLIIFPPQGEGNANLRKLEVDGHVIQATLVDEENLNDKGDPTKQTRVI